jgi:glycosyltransferase involved in cell wall biosynthesis
MKKVLIGTPSYDGNLNVWYVNSLVNTIKIAEHFDTVIFPVYMSYDSLVQRARNDLVKLALDEGFDDLIFIDADQEWSPDWVFRLLKAKEDVIAATVVKKSDQIAFNVKALPEGLKQEKSGFIEVESVGTGFMKISRKALQEIWNISPEYKNENKTNRMVFDIQIVDGELVSEDNIFCNKWRSLGNKVYIDPTMTCNHIGVKKYSGNFIKFIEHITAKEDVL